MDKRIFGTALAVAAIGIGLSACSSSGNKVAATGSTATTASTAAPASASSGGGIYGATPSTAAPAAAAASGPLVGVATDPKDGQFLVGANGHTLYLFEKDNGTTTACTGGCAAVWPGLASTGGTMAGPGVDASKISTVNGQVANQIAYNGHLLYFFSGDTAAGQINGTKIPAWYPVSPAGDKIDKD